VSYGQSHSYFPVADLLKRYMHVEDGDEAAHRPGQSDRAPPDFGRGAPGDHPALLAPDVLPPTALPEARSAQRRQRTLAALKRVLLRESQVQPCPGLRRPHWIDSETQALLDNLVESLPTAHVLLLANYRQSISTAGGANSTRNYGSTRAAANARTAAGSWRQSQPDAAEAALIARTEGNPFLLEESVRTLWRP